VSPWTWIANRWNPSLPEPRRYAPPEPKPPRIFTPAEVRSELQRGGSDSDNTWQYALRDAFRHGDLDLGQLATIEGLDGSIVDESFVAYGTLVDGRWWLAWSTNCHSGSCWAGGTFAAETKADLVRLHMTSEQRVALLDEPPGNSSREAMADLGPRLERVSDALIQHPKAPVGP
jgi:hypothetical protein